MAKRRTRKQKQRAKHEFTVSWEPKESKGNPKTKRAINQTVEKDEAKNLKLLQKNETSKIKKDIFKSLFLAGLIIGIEVALYFTWQ